MAMRTIAAPRTTSIDASRVDAEAPRFEAWVAMPRASYRCFRGDFAADRSPLVSPQLSLERSCIRGTLTALGTPSKGGRIHEPPKDRRRHPRLSPDLAPDSLHALVRVVPDHGAGARWRRRH